jgi:hypothetical protein
MAGGHEGTLSASMAKGGNRRTDFGVEPMTRIETYQVFGLCVALAAGGSMLQGCSDSGSGSGAPGTTGAAGSTTAGPGTTTTGGGTGTGGAGGSGGGGPAMAVTYCATPAKAPVPVMNAGISDFDGEAGPLVQSIMPGGVWMPDVDGTGTPKADSIAVEPCGTTQNGLHFHGTGHTGWGADAAAAIVDPTQPVDVSMYSGISFVMNSKTTPGLIFKLQNPYSDPTCGKCNDMIAGAACYAGFTRDVALAANSNTPIIVKWTDLTQQTWGYTPPGVGKFDPGNLTSIAFAFNGNVDFDVCIDDVKFIP